MKKSSGGETAALQRRVCKQTVSHRVNTSRPAAPREDHSPSRNELPRENVDNSLLGGFESKLKIFLTLS